MPERVVRPGILTSDAINRLSWQEEVFYRRLMSVVDDYGRFDGRDSVLRANLYPLRLDHVSDSDVRKWKTSCSEAGVVRLYFVDEKPFIEILKFDQRMRGKPRWPAPIDGDLTATRGNSQQSAATRAKIRLSSETNTETNTNTGAACAPCLPFSSPEFGETWAHFVRHRCEIKKPIKPTAAEEILREIACHGEQEAIAALKKSIVSGWPGVYFDGKGPANGHKPPPATQDPERQKQRERERQEHNRRMAELAQQEALADLERARKRQEAMKEAVPT